MPTFWQLSDIERDVADDILNSLRRSIHAVKENPDSPNQASPSVFASRPHRCWKRVWANATAFVAEHSQATRWEEVNRVAIEEDYDGETIVRLYLERAVLFPDPRIAATVEESQQLRSALSELSRLHESNAQFSNMTECWHNAMAHAHDFFKECEKRLLEITDRKELSRLIARLNQAKRDTHYLNRGSTDQDIRFWNESVVMAQSAFGVDSSEARTKMQQFQRQRDLYNPDPHDYRPIPVTLHPMGTPQWVKDIRVFLDEFHERNPQYRKETVA